MTTPLETTQPIDRLTRRVMGPLQWPVLMLASGVAVETIAGGVVGLATFDARQR